MVGAQEVVPYDGQVFVADTSAWARSGHPAVRNDWGAVYQNRQIVRSPLVEMELLYSARNSEEFDTIAARLGELRNVPITRSVTNAALQALRQLAYARPQTHRSVKPQDLLIAAAGQDAAVGVLHYDADFDTLATVLNFESRWIAPAGSL